MSHLLKAGADKAPVILGGGILGVALGGVFVGIAGYSLSLLAEVLLAGVGMLAAGRYS
jgi:uncharacterized protein involved in exopolysaccharide biosynthesis